jgi:hypothetical protein
MMAILSAYYARSNFLAIARKPYACAKENPPNPPNPPLTMRNSLGALGGSAGETF